METNGNQKRIANLLSHGQWRRGGLTANSAGDAGDGIYDGTMGFGRDSDMKLRKDVQALR